MHLSVLSCRPAKRNFFLLPIFLHSLLNDQVALCMTVRTASGGISSFTSSGFNSTAAASATGSYGNSDNGTTAATQTRSGVTAGTTITAHPDFGSGPCPTKAADYPSFIMPTINPTESCDIYGPLCQTGSIAVGVKTADGATATTTVPCSCYLTAQSLTVIPTASPWHLGYGRSQQCISLLQIRFTPTMALNAPIYSSCPKGHFPGAPDISESVLNATFPRLPQEGIDYNRDSGSCCGMCDVRIPRVRISFFPDAHEPKCANGNNNAKSSAAKPIVTPPPHSTLVHRALHRRGNASIAASNGFTYTYPSLYMEIDQVFSLTDDCGTMGKGYSSTILAFPPGGLSTVSYDVPLGQDFGSAVAGPLAYGHTKTLNPNDMACPTWGLSGPYNPDANAMPFLAPGDAGIDILPDGKPSEVVAGAGVTVGPPFYPVIVVPTGLLTLDPAWARCSTILNQFIPIFDPPRTLAVQDIMGGPAAPPPPPPPTPTPQAEMVPPPSASPPAAVGDPGVQTGIVQEQADPTKPGAFDAGLPATAVPPAPQVTPPPANVPAPAASAPQITPPANVPTPAVQSVDPAAAAVRSSSSPAAPAQNPPMKPQAAPKDPILPAQLNAALAVTKSSVAAPAPVSPPNTVINAPAPVQPITPPAPVHSAPNDPAPTNPAPNNPVPSNPAPNNPAPANINNAPSSNAVAATLGAVVPSVAAPIVPDPGQSNSQPPAPAFANVINNPGTIAGPPAASSQPGLGKQIIRPFAPVATAQNTIQVAPVPAGSSGAEPSIGAQGAQNLPSNDNSPQQQQPTLPSNNNHNAPASIPNAVQSPPVLPTQPANAPSTSQNNPLSPPKSLPASNPPAPNPSEGQTSSPSHQQQQQSPAAPILPAITLDSQTYTRNSASAYVIASQTLIPGGAEVTISNPNSNPNPNTSGIASGNENQSQNNGATAATSAPAPVQISLASDGSIAVIGSSTQAIVANTAAAPSAPSPFSGTDSQPANAFTINSLPFVLNPTTLPTYAATGTAGTADALAGAAESGAVTLTALSQTATIANQPVALASSDGSVVLVEGSSGNASVVAVASATAVGGGVVVAPAPSGSAGASPVAQVGKNGAGRVGGGWARLMSVMIGFGIGIGLVA